MISEKIEVAAVLVTYNRVALLKRAIDSLLKQSVELKYIVIVNNNSTDGTRDYLDNNENDKIKFIHLNENTGGAGGFHVGINMACDLDISHVWIMDDDAIASETALESLIDANHFLMSKNIAPGFLCSYVLSDSGDCMNVPEISKKKGGAGYSNWPEFASEGIIGVDKATFVSVFLSTDVVKGLGLPIKEMFIWGDDSEYTWRISNKYHCYLVAKSIVYHKRVLAKSLSLVTEENPVRISWYKFLYRNSFYNIKKHGRKKDFIFYFSHIFNEIIKILLHAKNQKFKKVFTIILGVLGALFFNPKIKFPGE